MPEQAHHFDANLAEPIACIELGIENLTKGDAGLALDDFLAARLLLTGLLARSGSPGASAPRPA